MQCGGPKRAVSVHVLFFACCDDCRKCCVTVTTMAAVAFAGLLVVIMRSDEVRGILTDLVRRALTVS